VLGDVAILLRSLSDAQVYEEALREVGLDYYLAGGHAFYSQQEIYDVLNLLRAVASMVDEIALAGALRSPLFALADETLFWLVDHAGSLNATLAADELPTQLAANEVAKVRRAATTLATLRGAKDRMLVAELLALALELTGYDATLLAEFLGPRKAATLEKLVEQARTIDRGSPGDLPAFITQLSEFVLQAPKEALAATEAEGGDVIRIMTIHHAKGLEFPLVVVADLERQRHLGGAEPVLDPDLGPLVPLSEREATIGYDLYRRRENAEDLEERKRLLYVATTRAADYLMLSSSVDDLDRPKSDWLQLIDARISLNDGSLRTPLPAGYDAPHLRVTTTRPPLVEALDGQPRGADLDRLVIKTRELVAKGSRPVPRESLAIPVDAGARRRFSFSRISGALAPASYALDADGEETPNEPSASDRIQTGAKLTESDDARAREFGVLVHAVLESLDFRRPSDVETWAQFLAPQYVGAEPERAAAEAAMLVNRFLQTPLAAELAAAPVVRREVEFLLPWPPDSKAVSKAGGPYLHGFIDCLYQDAAGRWRLIDYKTNRVAATEVTQVAGAYMPQMLAYRLACEQALGESLAECTLVLLHPGVMHTLAWDVAAERRGIDEISAAIAALTLSPTSQ
jgi:ATP-dependent helicase/nuclease subunit A